MNTPDVLLDNKSYDRVKYATTIVIPAFAALYYGLAQLFELPYGEEVPAAAALIATFLGTLIGLSSKTYKKVENSPEALDGVLGTTGEDPDTGIPGLSLLITKDPVDLLDKDIVRLKVNSEGPATSPWDD